MKRLGSLALLVLLSACGGDSTSVPVADRIAVAPNTAIVTSVGDTRQFTARVVDDRGNEMVGAAVSWSSSDPGVASVDASGLATATGTGTASIRATADGLTGSGSLIVDLVPQELLKVSGDTQTGLIYQDLSNDPTVEVRDANGNPIQGASVTFAVQSGRGTVSLGVVQTGPDGRASTAWRLGCSNESPQRLQAFAGLLSVTFEATADLTQLVVCEGSLPRGRATQSYSAQLVAAGGIQGVLSWDLDPGSPPLPAGIVLNNDGSFSGVPANDGVFPIDVRVQDGLGGSATGPFLLRVCEAPLSLPVGGTRVLSTTAPDDCGFFLPAGAAGDRYRVGLVYATSFPDTLNPALVTVSMEEKDGAPNLAPRAQRPPQLASAFGVPVARVPSQESVAIQADLEASAATRAFHHHLREAERELLRRLRSEVEPLPDRSRLRLARSGGAPPRQAPAPDKRTFTHAAEDYTSCDLKETVTGIKIAENEHIVIYQDSTQNASSPVSLANVQSMLDYYRDHGKQVIDEYFGGVSDIDGDGRVVVLITPEVGGNTVAFVWSGDFFPKAQGCPASNEMELVRFNRATVQQLSADRPSYQALGALVHEVKHVSSLYKSILRDDYQPDWVEEGTAEIAGELSSRLAWAAAGGPAVGELVQFGHWTDGSPENWSVVLKMARTVGYLGSQPNGLLGTPVGAGPFHDAYGSGWHFHRWLGDAYGDAATPLADGPLFTALNDAGSLTAVQGVEATTGKPWAELMEEYLAAIMLTGTGAPPGPRSFSTYDFPGSIAAVDLLVNYSAQREGAYPWPVNLSGGSSSAPFATDVYSGSLGPSGVQVLDLASDGTGLGLEVEVTSSRQPVRVVVARIR
jgi:hypothetical protein